MASLADVNFALLRRDERRKLEESARTAQQDTQKRSSKMGLGRLLGTVTGSLLGLALAPVTGGASLFVTAGLAGVGSRVGSEWGQQVTNIRETDVNKQKLFRDTAADLRDEQFEAQRDLNRIANVRGFTDAFSVFSLGATAGGQAVMQGAQAAGIQGAWQGGKEYAKSKIASLVGGTKNELLQGTGLPAPTEIAKIEGALPWQDELMKTPAALTPAGVAAPSMLTAGQKIAKEGGSKLGTAALSTGTGPKPLMPIDNTRMSLDPTDVMNLRNRTPDISGTGSVSVDQIINRALEPPSGSVVPNKGAYRQVADLPTDWTSQAGGAVSAATPSRSTMLQSAVSQSLPTAPAWTTAATMGSANRMFRRSGGQAGETFEWNGNLYAGW